MRRLIYPPRLRSRTGAEPGRKVTWLELFFDLVFVAAVAQVGAPLAEDYTIAGLGRYAFLFLLIWWAWLGHTNFSTRFDTDDVLQRGLTLIQMFAVAAMAVNAKDALDSRSSAGFAGAYAAMRFVLVGQYLRARHVDAARQLATRLATGTGAAALLWVASAFVPAPDRFYLWAIALAIDLATPLAALSHTVSAPPDAAHLPERYGLFTIILIGEAMVAVMKGMESQETWSGPAAASAFIGMATAFLIWWWYFDGAHGATERLVRNRRDAVMFQLWTYSHLPMYLGIAITGVGLEHVVAMGGQGHLHDAQPWIFCGALAIVMAALIVIDISSDAAGRWRRTALTMVPHGVIAIATASMAFVGHTVAPVLLALILALLVATQLALALSRNGSSESTHHAAHAVKPSSLATIQ